MSKRALRRFHKERMKSKAKRLFPGWAKYYRAADNLTICSGPCCGNPRRWYGHMSHQEKKSLDDLNSWKW